MVDYDPEKHRTPYYVAWFISICYFICYLITCLNTFYDNTIHFRDIENHEWPELNGVTGGFSDYFMIWVILCAIRAILAILAWIVICLQGYWNVGTEYRMKYEALINEEQDPLMILIQNIYRHLFYGNPYLPSGIYEIKNIKSSF